MRSKASRFSLPAFLSVLAGVMFLFVLCLLVAGQPALSQYYQNLSLLSNLALWPIALAGVALLLTASGKLREFEYLEREPIETDNGAREQALSMQREVLPICAKRNTIGVVLCILSVLPLFALMCVPGVPDGYYSLAVCALLLLVGIACLLLVRTGSMRGAVDKLLEQGDYTRENKAKSRFVGAVSAAYWLVVTAAFLFYTFGPNGNGQPQYSWFIWAIAGVLYGALMAALSVYRKKSK